MKRVSPESRAGKLELAVPTLDGARSAGHFRAAHRPSARSKLTGNLRMARKLTSSANLHEPMADRTVQHVIGGQESALSIAPGSSQISVTWK